MSIILTNYIKRTRESLTDSIDVSLSIEIFSPCPKIVCKNGFTFSVQAGEYGNSIPKEQHPIIWTHFEVGFPSEIVEELIPYGEGLNEEEKTKSEVFGYVPGDIIEKIIYDNYGSKQLEPYGFMSYSVIKNRKEYFDEI